MAAGRRNSQSPRRLGWILELADVLAVIVAGVLLVALSIAGVVKSAQALASAVLAVLAVVAVAILRDRIARRRADEQLDDVHGDLAETRRSLNALKLGRPYHVIWHDTTWDLRAKDGSLAYVKRRKRIAFDQPDVISLYDFAAGAGKRATRYTIGKIVDDDLIVEGKKALLISLGRLYSRGDVIDFDMERTSHNAFKEPREYVSVLTRDLTARLRLAVHWPVDRGPNSLRLVTIAADRESRTTDVLDQITMLEGRHFYEYEVVEPEKGSNTMIEWNW